MNRDGRQSHAKVTGVERELQPRRLRRRDDEYVLINFDQRIGKVVGESPKREAGGRQRERESSIVEVRPQALHSNRRSLMAVLRDG